MIYADIRDRLQSGDTFACKRRGRISTFIRIFTAESANHIAVILRDPEGGVWVTEMREGQGYMITPASQWMHQTFARGTKITYCQAPEETSREAMRRQILKTRAIDPPYGYWTGVKVWWSQVRNRMTTAGDYPVCSTYAQQVHKAGGYSGYTRLADPGDIIEHSPLRIPVRG